MHLVASEPVASEPVASEQIADFLPDSAGRSRQQVLKLSRLESQYPDNQLDAKFCFCFSELFDGEVEVFDRMSG